jgi:hypothetical protein
VPPSKFGSGSITQDLGDHAVAKLIESLDHEKEKSQVSPSGERTSQISLNAAGATFSAPLYGSSHFSSAICRGISPTALSVPTLGCSY